MKNDICPNCGREPVIDHKPTTCILAVFAEIVSDRCNLTEEEIYELHRNCNPDALWDDVGKIVDRFEEGFYSDDGDDQ